MVFENDVFRLHVMYLQTILDITGALGCVCILALVTQAYGFGSSAARLQLLHRLGLVGVASAFAFHAYDIISAPARHGLTLPNIVLHILLIYCIIISGIRLRRAQLEIEAQGGYTAGSNGGMFTGPFHNH